MDRIPNAADFEAYRVTNVNSQEVIRQPLYDYNIYPGAGSQSLTFFQTPVGQGVTSALGATAATPKTRSDTNMDLAGQLPSGLQYMIEGIEVFCYPGSVATANTYTPATITFFAAAAAATVGGQVNDSNTFYQSGLFILNVLAKAYLTVTPLIQFVPRASFDLSAAVATNSATVGEVGTAVLRPGGEPFMLTPPVAIFPAVNFSAQVTWPAVVAMPSGFNARVGVQFNGYMLRAGQ